MLNFGCISNLLAELYSDCLCLLLCLVLRQGRGRDEDM